MAISLATAAAAAAEVVAAEPVSTLRLAMPLDSYTCTIATRNIITKTDGWVGAPSKQYCVSE